VTALINILYNFPLSLGSTESGLISKVVDFERVASERVEAPDPTAQFGLGVFEKDKILEESKSGREA